MVDRKPFPDKKLLKHMANSNDPPRTFIFTQISFPFM